MQNALGTSASSYALITGASTGIGRALSLELASQGYHVLLVARSADKLEELAEHIRQQYQVSAEFLAQDLTESNSIPKLLSWIDAHDFSVSILINNAGYAVWGNFARMEIDQLENMMQLNMNSLVRLSHAMIPRLATQDKAHILMVGSTAGYQSVPTLAIYAATKAFVINFSRGLRHELRKTSIQVTCLSPGPTESQFTDRAGMDALQDLTDKFNMPADKVARQAVRGMLRGKAEVVPGLTNVLSRLLGRIFPPALTTWFSANLYDKRLPAEKR